MPDKIDRKSKKKSSLQNLAGLLEETEKVDKELSEGKRTITPAVEKKKEPEQVKEEIAKPEETKREKEETPGVEYFDFFKTLEKYKDEKKESTFIYNSFRDILKRISEAENSNMTIIINNIIYAWIQDNKSNIKKSISKLVKDINI